MKAIASLKGPLKQVKGHKSSQFVSFCEAGALSGDPIPSMDHTHTSANPLNYYPVVLQA